jgi:hypothetical protein
MNTLPAGEWSGPGWDTGSATQTPGEPDPSGGSNAVLFTTSGGQYSSYCGGVNYYNISSWVLAGTGAGIEAILFGYPAALWAEVTSSLTTWSRIDVPVPGGNLPGDYLFDQRGIAGSPPVTTPASWTGAFPQAESNLYPSSYIGGGDSRSADVLSTTTNVAPGGLLLMTMVFAPNFAESEQGVDAALLWFGSANQVLLQQTTSKIAVMVADTIVLTSASLTWSRNQAITVMVSLDITGALSLTVTGATSGNGTTNASGVDPFVVGGTTYLLGTDDGAAECIDLQTVSFTTP